MDGFDLRAVAYVRVSNGNHEKSLSEQVLACRRHASDRFATVTEVYRDHGVSGGMAPASRPGFGALLERLEADPVDLVVVMSRDRLGRDAVEVALTEARLARLGVRVSSPDTPEGDSPHARFSTRILDASHELARDLARERTRASVKARRAAGLKLGAHAPLGFVADTDGVLVPHEPEQRALARARELRGQGLGWLRIARALDTEGHPARGARWVPATLRLALEPGAREKSRKLQAKRRTERAKAEEDEHALPSCARPQ